MSVDALAQTLAELGDVRVVLSGTILTAAFLMWRHDGDIARGFASGIILCIAATAALKLFGLVLERTSASTLIGSPSGHVALGTAFVGSLGLVLSHNRGMLGRVASFICTALVILAIAHSRIAKDAHSTFEVVEGVVLGLIGLVPLFAVMIRRNRTQSTIPAWPPILAIAIVVVAVFPMQDLDTELTLRRVADWLPIRSR
jgi:membrane-associated phospholipid phosphatase